MGKIKEIEESEMLEPIPKTDSAVRGSTKKPNRSQGTTA
jgi:hypothetical protein